MTTETKTGAIVAKEKAPRELVPEDSYPARCVQMVWMGTIPDTYLGKPIKKNKVRLTWELPTLLKAYGDDPTPKPAFISKEYTLSLSKKGNLRPMLQGWRGKEFSAEEAASFDVAVLVGKPCFMQIIHKTSGTGNKYEDVNISKLPKGFECPAQISPSLVFSYNNPKEVVLALFEKLTQWVKDDVVTSDEWKAMMGDQKIPAAGGMVDVSEDDDLPF